MSQGRSCAVAVAALVGLLAAPAVAQADDGPHTHQRPVGYAHADRPPIDRATCSFSQPFCVHAHPETTLPVLRAVEETAERTLQLFRGMGLPHPMVDGSRGGSSAFDIYIVKHDPAAHGGQRAHAQVDAIPTTLGFDRAASYGVIVGDAPGPACQLASDVARTVAQAMLLAIDGAVAEGILAAQASYLAHLVQPCAPLALDALDRMQQRPDLAITHGSAGELSGSLLFPWYLDDRYGMGGFGAVMTGSIAVTGQLTPAGHTHYLNEPDVFDSLRVTTRQRDKSLGEMLIDYAVARAFMGDRSDDAHLFGVDWLDTLGRVRFEWAFGWNDLPKRVAHAYPVEPTGSAYIWFDLSDRAADAEALIVAEWEPTHVFQWAVVRIDARGRERGRHLLGGTFGEHEAQLTLRDLSDTAALLIVGTHVGNDDRSKPFDPDRGAARVAGWEVSVHPQ